MKRNLILLLSSLFFSAVAIEVFLRIAGMEYTTFVVSDPDLGWSLRKGGRGWYRAEGNAYVEINSHGFRGPDVPLEKPAGTYRIAMLGDSFTVALDVADEKAVPHLLGKELQSCARFNGKKVEVLNFGVGGYGTAQELILFRKRALAFKPDLVVLQFFVSNDIFDNYRSLRESLKEQAPYFIPDGKGNLVLDDSFRAKQDKRWILDAGGTAIYYSRFLQLCNQVRKVVAITFTTIMYNRSKAANIAVSSDPYPPAEVEKAFQVTEAILGQLNDECKRNGIQLAVAVIPAPFAVVPNSAAISGDLSALNYDLRIQAINKKLEIPTLLYGPPMAKHATDNNEYLYGFPGRPIGTGHWNHKGHELAGHLLARFLCSLSAPDPVAQTAK